MVDVNENPFDGTDSIFERKQPLKKDTFTPDTIFTATRKSNLHQRT